MTGILGNISLVKYYTDPGSESYERLLEAEKASIYARELTQQLLTFSRGGAPVKRTISIRRLTKESAGLALSGSKSRCEFFFPDDPLPVEADEGQINQVISNLIINADHAMPEGGVIKVSTENVAVDEGWNIPLKKGKYVKISITDNGIGIPREHLQKIFDPYFTTKEKGSGLGLASSYSIVNKHGGYICANSELGIGTTFDIYLPASEKKTVEMDNNNTDLFVGNSRVLIMDDEKIVRDIAGKMLSHLGYDVAVTREGMEAIDLYKKAKEAGKPFDVVIMDLTIQGGMGGKEAIKELLGIDPEAKVIVSSGYSNDPIMADFKEYGFKGVVAKPYKLKELSEVVHKVTNFP